jgi:competence protein ComEA
MAIPAMGPGCVPAKTCGTGEPRRQHTKETAMKIFRSASRSLALGLFLAAGALSASLPGVAMAADRVDINSADAATIDAALMNIGRSKADAIVAYRKEHGAFKSADQLALVKGIGLATIEKNRARIVVGGGGGKAAAMAVPAKAVAKK